MRKQREHGREVLHFALDFLQRKHATEICCRFAGRCAGTDESDWVEGPMSQALFAAVILLDDGTMDMELLVPAWRSYSVPRQRSKKNITSICSFGVVMVLCEASLDTC